MTLAAIMDALGRVGLAEYPSPRVAGAASALVEAYRETVKTSQAPVVQVIEDAVEPAVGRSGFDMRRERF